MPGSAPGGRTGACCSTSRLGWYCPLGVVLWVSRAFGTAPAWVFGCWGVGAKLGCPPGAAGVACCGCGDAGCCWPPCGAAAAEGGRCCCYVAPGGTGTPAPGCVGGTP